MIDKLPKPPTRLDNEKDYEAALSLISAWWDRVPGDKRNAIFDQWVDLVVEYESRVYKDEFYRD
jgi:hypothetical protein